MNPPLKLRISLARDILRGRLVDELVIGKAFRAATQRACEKAIETVSVRTRLPNGAMATVKASNYHQGGIVGLRSGEIPAALTPRAEFVVPERGSGDEGNHFTLGDYYVHLISIIDHGKGRSVLYRRAHDPKGTVRRMGLQTWSKKAKPA